MPDPYLFIALITPPGHRLKTYYFILQDFCRIFYVIPSPPPPHPGIILNPHVMNDLRISQEYSCVFNFLQKCRLVGS